MIKYTVTLSVYDENDRIVNKVYETEVNESYRGEENMKVTAVNVAASENGHQQYIAGSATRVNP
jgi:hypothetical protein